MISILFLLISVLALIGTTLTHGLQQTDLYIVWGTCLISSQIK